MAPRSSRSRWLATASILAAVGLIAVALPGGSDHHRLVVVTPDAVGVLAGQEIRAGGAVVGHVATVAAIDRGQAARVTLNIDDRYWPVSRNSLWRVRWGGTAAFNSRYVELTPGTPAAGVLRDDERIAPTAFRTPVEFDEVLATFTRPVRSDARRMILAAGAAMKDASMPLRSSLTGAPQAVAQVAAVTDDLDADSSDLDVAVRHMDGVVGAVDRADPDVGRLVSNAGLTFHAVARRTDQLKAALSAAPGLLIAARGTLDRLRETLTQTGDVTARLRPGVGELARVADPLDRALGGLSAVGPDAVSALTSARRTTPELNPLLARATGLMPTLAAIGRQGAGELRCVRPYTPEIVSWFSTWGDFLDLSDGKDRYGRLLVTAPLVPNGTPLSPAQTAASLPQLTYAYPRPPGIAAGQPWLQPDCGAGREVFDPSADPETRPSSLKDVR